MKEIDDYLLLMGGDIPYNNFHIVQHNLRYLIKEISMEKYLFLSSLASLTPKEIMSEESEFYHQLCGLHLFDFAKISDFTMNWLINFLNAFTDCEWRYNDFLQTIESFSLEKPVYIKAKELDEIFNIFKKAYAIQEPKSKFDETKAVDEETAQLVKEFRELEKEMSKKKGSKITLHSIIESVASKGVGYNLTDIWNLTMYQLMRTYNRIDTISNYNATIQGLYNGTVNGEKVKIDDIYWANENTL